MKGPMIYLVALLAVPAGAIAGPDPLAEVEALDQRISAAVSGVRVDTTEKIHGLGDLQELEVGTYDVGHSEGEWSQYYFSAKGIGVDAIVHSKDSMRAMISEIHITGDAWVLSDGAKVGMPVEEIQWPVKAKGEMLEACGINNCIEFSVDSGQVSEIHISLYVD